MPQRPDARHTDDERIETSRLFAMKLYIGNKNYSSWSLRPWLLMRATGIAFEEVRLRLDSSPGSTFKTTLAAISPTAKVPVLLEDDGFAIWETPAIAEYLAEKYPDKPIWPRDGRSRARARSLCAEMHAGFADLRQYCPMNVEALLPEDGARLLRDVPGVGRDLARIVDMWLPLLQASGGFLFGELSNADACFAPVCLRIRTYALPVPAEIDRYLNRLLQLPAMVDWIGAARAEHDFLPEDEPYRVPA